MKFTIIKAEDRLAEKGGIKALILGPPGVGKTSLLRTLDPEKTLFLDLEAGALSVQDVPVDELRPKDWLECKNLACLLGGPDYNAKPEDDYSEAHYEHVAASADGLDLDKYDTYFIDSITVAGRICFAWCEQQPEAFNAKGVKDPRGAYGLHGREMVRWISRLQQARSKNVIFVCLLDEKEDDFGRKTWAPQIEGSKTGREMPGIVDEVLTYQFIHDDQGKYRAFVTSADNEWNYPAKDRSGKLAPLEEPHLGKLFAKLSGTEGHSAKNTPSAPAATTQQNQMETA